MKNIINSVLAFGILLSSCSLIAAAAEPYPLEYFALREVVRNVNLSPNGELLAMLTIPTKKGDPILEIYDASDLSKQPFRVNADPMEITNYYWISDNNIVMIMRQKVRDKIDGFNQGVYETVVARLDVKNQKIKKFNDTNLSVASLLPNKKDKVILALSPKDASKSKLDPRFKPQSYYEFNLKNGRKKLLFKGKIALGQVEFDADGNRTFARGYERSTGTYLWFVRDQKKDSWNEIFRLSEDSFEQFTIEGFDIKPNTLLVSAQNGKDKVGLWEFDYVKKAFGEQIYLRSDVDVVGVRHHSNKWSNSDTITGIVYATDKYHTEYFDAVEEATYAQLEKLIPSAHSVSISSRARKGQTMVIYNSGPRDPGTYYLLKDGKLTTIGSKQPLLKSVDLADVKYINYKSRDDKTIYAYLTVPNGKGPFPLVVMPHGGPFVHEVVGYDEWAQMLANNGYMVLQPEYRGSKGYGLDFYKSAFINGGQGGYKMQDDKDDGVKHLIKEGLVKSDRVAMFGWSYGGYAALVAASRTPQLYQCVIAGAAVSDNMMQVNYYRDRMRGAGKVEQLSTWMDSISPVKEAAKVNVPILLIHGSVDQRVPLEHAKVYRDELDKYNKPYKYVELDGADHFYSTLFFRHQIKLYQSMIDYLKNDCGPEGL